MTFCGFSALIGKFTDMGSLVHWFTGSLVHWFIRGVIQQEFSTR